MARKRTNQTSNQPSAATKTAVLQSFASFRAQGVPFAKLDELRPWEDNPRMNAAAIPAVVESMKRFGWTNPVLVRAADGMVIAGHTRLAAARHLGLDEVPIVRLEHSEADARLYAVADNRLSEIAEWDMQLLHRVMADFDADDALSAGWDRADLDAVAEAAGSFAAQPLADAFAGIPNDRPDARQVTFILSVEDLGVMNATFERMMAASGQTLRGSALKSWALMELVRRHG